MGYVLSVTWFWDGVRPVWTLVLSPGFVGVLDAARKKTIRLYVWGWASYNDVFKGTPGHLSEFCDELTDVTISSEDASLSSAQFNWKLLLCRNHNCYDNECSDYAERLKTR